MEENDFPFEICYEFHWNKAKRHTQWALEHAACTTKPNFKKILISPSTMIRTITSSFIQIQSVSSFIALIYVAHRTHRTLHQIRMRLISLCRTLAVIIGNIEKWQHILLPFGFRCRLFGRRPLSPEWMCGRCTWCCCCGRRRRNWFRLNLSRWTTRRTTNQQSFGCCRMSCDNRLTRWCCSEIHSFRSSMRWTEWCFRSNLSQLKQQNLNLNWNH